MSSRVICGDCLLVMPTLPENSVDSIITDPPYGLSFMGQNWDCGVPNVPFWQAALRVAKPGAILMAFGGTRTEHRLTCYIEDAGWEIRDKICWLYGSGFPKSLDISKGLDMRAGFWRGRAGELESNNGSMSGGNYERTSKGEPITPEAKLWRGYGTGLKPAWEPIIVAQKPLDGSFLDNALKWGVAGYDVEGAKIGAEAMPRQVRGKGDPRWKTAVEGMVTEEHEGRWPANLLLDEEAAALLDQQSGMSESVQSIRKRAGDGIGTGNAVINFIGFPSGYDEVGGFNDFGGASRFFYTAKASVGEKNEGLDDMEEVAAGAMEGNHDGSLSGHIVMAKNYHPTVKPVDLMRYLCKLTRTPTGGLVLDPFLGSGTTGIAAFLEHRDFIDIEIDKGYAEIARKRIDDIIGPLFTESLFAESEEPFNEELFP